MDSKMLLDSWEQKGSDLDEFKALMADRDDNTMFLEVYNDTLGLCSLNRDDQNTGYIIDSRFIQRLRAGNGALMKVEVPKSDPSLFNETYFGTGFLLTRDNVKKSTRFSCDVNHPIAYYTSLRFMDTFAKRCDVKAERISKPSIARDIFIMDGLYESCQDSKPKKGRSILVIRHADHEVNGQMKKRRKVFAALSASYVGTKLSIIPEICELIMNDGTLGKAEFHSYSCSNFATEGIVEFPEIAKRMQEKYGLKDLIIPGIRIKSSDTGDASISVSGTYRVESSESYVIYQKTTRRNTGKFSEDEIMKDVNNVFSKMEDLPRCLSTKVKSFISSANTRKMNWTDENFSNISDAYKKAMDRLNMQTLLGAKRSKRLLNDILGDVNATKQYSEYDIAVTLLKAGDRIPPMNTSVVEQIRETLSRTAKFSYVVRHDDDYVKTETA